MSFDAPLRGRTALFLHAHPDDEAIFTAVTMRRLADLGARVVLVTATGGELGEPLLPLRPGESMRDRRVAELETAAAALGVDRLVVLAHRDSGLPGWRSGRHPRALARASVPRLARRVADLALAEGAEAVVHDDDRGIYGHPDHVAGHRAGAAAARLAGAVGYETTVDRDALWQVGGHVLDHASSRPGDYGRHAGQISLSLTASDAELAAKRSAMAAHASQIPPAALDRERFADRYAREWFVRRDHRPGLLDEATVTLALA